MSQTSDAIAALSAALRDAIVIIREKLTEKATSDQAKLDEANSQIATLRSQLASAMSDLATAEVDDSTLAATVTSAAAEFSSQLQELVAIAQASTPPES